MNSEQLRSMFTLFYRGHLERDAELGIEEFDHSRSPNPTMVKGAAR